MWSRKSLGDILVAKDGELRAWHYRCHSHGTDHLQMRVDSPEYAIKVLDRIAQRDLNNDNVEWNSQGLVVWEDNEWSEWYSPIGDDIGGYADRLNPTTEQDDA